MRRLMMVGTYLFGAALSLGALHAACISGPPGGGGSCFEAASFSSMEELEAHRVVTFDEYAAQSRLTLSAEQTEKLQKDGHLAGQVALARPVKWPNGQVDVPAGWMRELPPEHPWNNVPSIDDPAFAGWFEYRVVEPLLYDPQDPQHREWAAAYLKSVRSGASGAEGKIIGLAGAASGC